VQKTEKEKVVEELTERLRSTDALIVADYRGLTNSELVGLRTSLRASGAKLQVVKNTLTRRAAEAAGADALLTLLEGPTAIAFVETDGDPVAVAKALSDVAKATKILSLRGGVLSGRALSEADVEELAKLPAPEVVKSQLVGAIIAPLTQLLGLLEAPVRDLVGLIDARIAQLEEQGDVSGAVAAPPAETTETAEEPQAETETDEPAEVAEEPQAATDADEVADEPPAAETTDDETQE
jgi:large subunit ribosomal protein L10